MRLPEWYFVQVVVWLLTSVPLYAAVAIWGPPDWFWLFQPLPKDLSIWEKAIFIVIFLHPLLTLPLAILSMARRNKRA
jgi:hypothetical protein